VSYTLLNGSPVSVTYQARGFTETAFTKPKYGIFAQDQVAWKRLTANLGLRFDYYRAGYPDQTAPRMPFVPNERFFPGQVLVRWKDLSPRLGVAYDLFGTGKTALKVSVSRYVGAGLAGNSGPIGILGNDTRRWTDNNNNFIPDGDPTNPALNDELGPRTNGLFASSATPIVYDPSTQGWRKRPDSNWEVSAGIQHELIPRVSINAAYFRRMYETFLVTDNVAVAPTNYDPYCVTTPIDSRLPGGGGQQLCGLYDLNPTKVGSTQNVRKSSSQFGDQSDNFNGGDITINARPQSGAVVGAGISFGKWMADNCDIVTRFHGEVTASNSLQTFAVSTQGFNVGALTFSSGPSVSTSFCHLETPVLTQGKVFGSYTLPWDFQVSGVFQSLPGPMILANAAFTSGQIAPSLGRPLAAAAAVTINIVKPGTLWGPRLNQVDLRLAKTIKAGRTRVQGTIDFFNALNVNTVLGFNNTYGSTGATWMAPGQILAPRLVKAGVQVNF